MVEYFSHDYNARNDIKLKNLTMKHGLEGIGLYWCIIEMLYENEGRLSEDEIQIIAFDVRTTKELINSVIDDFGLFERRDGYFFSNGVLKRLKIRKETSESRRNAANKRWKKEKSMQMQCTSNANALQNECKCNAIKENKSKVNKSKVNKSKDIDNIILHDTDKSATVQDATPVVAKIVLNDKSIYEVHQSSVDHYKELYPAVDIIQELRNMQGWCEANTANRKTRKGIERFINSWLQKKQDRGTNQNRQKGNNNYDTAYERISRSEQNGDTYNDFTKPKKWL